MDKALELHGQSASTEAFSASKGWFYRFCKRFNLTWRRRTTIAQKLPADAIPRLVGYCMSVRRLQMKNGYLTSDVIAADETSIGVDMVGNSTLDTVGVSEVPIRSSGHEKTHLSLMLSARGDGRKLPIYMVFKRSRKLPDIEKQFHGKLVIGYNPKNSWFDQRITEDYVRRVLGQKLFGGRRMLAWDAFR
jgi:hypothetical protein